MGSEEQEGRATCCLMGTVSPEALEMGSRVGVLNALPVRSEGTELAVTILSH